MLRVLFPGVDSSNDRGVSLRSFAASQSGSVAVPFGLMSVVLFVFIGVGVDIARWQDARSKTKSALDTAVLAGGRALQTNGGDQADAILVAKTYYTEAVKSRLTVSDDSVNFKVGDSGSSVEAFGIANIETPFLKLAGIATLPLIGDSASDKPSAILEVGENARSNFEISLVLDTTGSMGEGTKLSDLKAAANDLVDILVWDNQSQYYSKVSLVPYATAVQVGSYATAVRGSPTGNYCMWGDCGYRLFRNMLGWMTVNQIDTCVSERTGANAFTDASPSAGGFVGKNFAGRYNPCLSGQVVPLTNDKTLLKSNIDALTAGGSSAGQIGIAWGWYTLAPDWGYLWPAQSRPATYGKKDVKKIVVLMTDGEYNSAYCKGVISMDSPYGSGAPDDKIDCNATNGDSYQQSLKLCTNMKAAGIKVYTVGFQTWDTPQAQQLLSECASDSTSAYNAQDGESLRAAFRAIALKVSNLYLTN